MSRAADNLSLTAVTHLCRGLLFRTLRPAESSAKIRERKCERLYDRLAKCGDDVCALMLEVIRNHDCGLSRFLRDATIDESKLQDARGAEATANALRVRYLHRGRCGLATSATASSWNRSVFRRAVK
jgi:hypothetical protein